MEAGLIPTILRYFFLLKTELDLSMFEFDEKVSEAFF